jgi:sugar lactone lactonase YvrE
MEKESIAIIIVNDTCLKLFVCILACINIVVLQGCCLLDLSTNEGKIVPESNGRIKTITKGHQWPESIDVDSNGNLYFSDAVEGTLFFIEKIGQGSKWKTKKIIDNFERASGLSIDQENSQLYLGISAQIDNGEKHGILRLPLSLLGKIADKKPINGTNFFNEKFRQDNGVLLADIPKLTNGIVYYQPENEVYYTWLRLGFGSIFRLRGHIGRISFDKRDVDYKPIPIYSPNGIVVESGKMGPELIVAVTLENKIKILKPPKYDTATAATIDLRKSGKKRYCHLPDGLIRRENGDLVVAAFGSGQILYLKRNGDSYEKPTVIAKVPGNPTDVVIAQSLAGNGKSLFVTLTHWHRIFNRSIRKGAVIEIPNVVPRIQLTK